MTVPIWLFAIQLVATLAVVGTFWVYVRQLRVMQAHFAEFTAANRTQNTITLIQYIQQPDLIAARSGLYSLRGIPLSRWTDQQRMIAERACSGWDVVGLLTKDSASLTSRRLVIETWGYGIVKGHMIATELLKEVRADRGSEYWDDFDLLAIEARDSASGKRAISEFAVPPNLGMQPTAR